MTKVMFFKMGQWEWVIIDDLIPMSPDEEETPLFANCKVGDPRICRKALLVSTPNPNPISALTSHFGCGDWLQIIGYLTSDTLTSEGLHDFAQKTTCTKIYNYGSMKASLEDSRSQDKLIIKFVLGLKRPDKTGHTLELCSYLDHLPSKDCVT